MHQTPFDVLLWHAVLRDGSWGSVCQSWYVRDWLYNHQSNCLFYVNKWTTVFPPLCYNHHENSFNIISFLWQIQRAWQCFSIKMKDKYHCTNIAHPSLTQMVILSPWSDGIFYIGEMVYWYWKGLHLEQKADSIVKGHSLWVTNCSKMKCLGNYEPQSLISNLLYVLVMFAEIWAHCRIFLYKWTITFHPMEGAKLRQPF